MEYSAKWHDVSSKKHACSSLDFFGGVPGRQSTMVDSQMVLHFTCRALRITLYVSQKNERRIYNE